MFLVSLGVVKDVNPDRAEDVFVQDVDFTFHDTELCFRWSGFNHPSEEITFELAVSSDGSADDIISFETMTDVSLRHCFDVPTMDHLSTYYGILKSTTDSGQVIQVSDGVMFVDSTYELATAQVHDGPGCFNAHIRHEEEPGAVADGAEVEVELTLMFGR